MRIGQNGTCYAGGVGDVEGELEKDNVTMTRAGRETEVVVAVLESFLAGSPVHVKSPDYLYDHEAKENREVDVSIRGRLGTSEILVVMECRDRKKVQGVAWIEQIIQKTRGLRADKVIAVSTSGFTKGAEEKAEANGVELRHLSDLTDEALAETFGRVSIRCLYPKFEILFRFVNVVPRRHTGRIDLEKLKPPKKIEVKQGRDSSPLLLVEKAGIKISLIQLVDACQDSLFTGANPNEEPIEKELQLFFGDPENVLLVDFDDQIYRVALIKLRVRLWVVEETVPVSEVRSYSKDGREMAHHFHFKWKAPDGADLSASLMHRLESESENIATVTTS